MLKRKRFGTPALCAASAIVCAFALFHCNSAEITAKIAPLKVAAAGYHLEETPGTQNVTVSVNAMKLLPADRDALETAAKKANGALPALPKSYAAARTQGRDGEWFRWGRLADKQTGITVSIQKDGELPISVYGVAGAWGATTLLVNTSGQTVTVRYRIRLGRGAYETQVLRFSPAKPETALAAQETPPAAPNYDNCETRLTYLDGCDFGAVHTAERQVLLLPGEAALVRANNVARAVVGAYYTAYELLGELRGSAPGPANRLRKMLRDGEASLQSLALPAGRHGSGSARRLGAIHHLLLLTAQAQSLERNYLARHTVKQTEGAALAAALEALSVALSQTSAVALNLVPQIETTPNERGDAIRVAISLRNGGTQSVDSVKLGLDNKSLPAQAVCQPSDPAYFGALRPGQSVETTFEVHPPAGAGLTGARYTADVSYLAASCPAHLRPRSQF